MKKIKYLRKYIKLLKFNEETLLNSHINDNPSGIRYDWLYRLYTVINLPEDDEQNVKRYGWSYVDEMVKNHIVKVNEFLFQLDMLEYVDLDVENVIQLDEFNVKIVLKFKWINLKRLFRVCLFGTISLLLLGGILLLFL